MASDDNDWKPVKRRNKPTLVCANCKKRKVRCDRQLPCSSCIKIKQTGGCTYESPWRPLETKKSSAHLSLGNSKKRPVRSQSLEGLEVKSRNLEAEITSLKSEVKSKPKIDSPQTERKDSIDDDTGETMNFYEEFRPLDLKGLTIYYGPFTSKYMISRDRWIRAIWETRDLFSLIKGYVDELGEKFSIEFSDKSAEELKRSQGQDETLTSSSQKKTIILTNEYRECTGNVPNKSFGEINEDVESYFLKHLQRVLPSKKVTWSLVERFFRVSYPFVPYVDEGYFYEELTSLLGEIDYTDVPFGPISIKKRDDLFTLAVCIILQEIGYISLFSNRECLNETRKNLDKDFLFKKPINEDALKVVQLLVDYTHSSRSAKFKNFQCLLLLETYRRISHEAFDGILETTTSLPILALKQDAFFLGLNRDPEVLSDANIDERTANLRRKIWHFLLRCDKVYGFFSGDYPLIDLRCCDTKKPYTTKENYNSKDPKIEENVSFLTEHISNVLTIFSSIYNTIIDVRSQVEISSLRSKIHDLESAFAHHSLETTHSLEKASFDYLSPERYVITSLSRFQLFCKVAIFIIYYHIFLHYETKNNHGMAYSYVKRLYTTMSEIIPFFALILHGPLSDIAHIINPLFQQAVVSTAEFNMGFLVRVTYLLLELEKIQKSNSCPEGSRLNEIKTKYDLLYTTLLKMARFFPLLIMKISQRCFSAWRSLPTFNCLNSNIESANFKEYLISEKENVPILRLEGSNLDELNRLLKGVSEKLGRVALFDDSVEQPTNINEILSGKKHVNSHHYDSRGKVTENADKVDTTLAPSEQSNIPYVFNNFTTPVGTNGNIGEWGREAGPAFDGTNSFALENSNFPSNSVNQKWLLRMLLRFNGADLNEAFPMESGVSIMEHEYQDNNYTTANGIDMRPSDNSANGASEYARESIIEMLDFGLDPLLDVNFNSML